MKKNFKITQTDSGSYITWVSEGCGKHRKKAKITGSPLSMYRKIYIIEPMLIV